MKMNEFEKEVNRKYREEYYRVHKERINRHRRTNKTKCECGSFIRTDNLNIHIKSLKHQQYESEICN